MLAQLKFSDVKRTTSGGNATDRARAKIVAAIAEQRASVEAAIKREPFTATRRVGGEMRERRFRPWYFKAAGLWFTTVNYGTSPLPLPGGNSIEAGPRLDGLLAAYDHVVAAVEAGELDQVILEAAARRGRKSKGAADPEVPAQAPAKPARGTGVSGGVRGRRGA